MILQKLRFRTKLFLGFLFVILSVIVISVIGIINLNKLHQKTDLIYKHPLAVSNAVREVNM